MENTEKYHAQEEAITKLFKLCPENKDISDILLKAATLNDFYSTNIFAIFPVAKHILSLKNIDVRLVAADDDYSLISEIQKVKIKGKERNFYSFATKYCSHHNPEKYPIYDSYVEKVLCYFQKRDKFASFDKKEWK